MKKDPICNFVAVLTHQNDEVSFEKFCENRELSMKFLRVCVNNLIAREV